MLGVVYVASGPPRWLRHHGGPDHSEEGSFTMAADQNTSSLQMKHINLAALTKRLEEHADGIENLAARPMADDMRLAALVIDRLVGEIRTAAATTNAAIAHLVNLVGWQWQDERPSR
jgi:hypothetical protein